MTNLLIRGSGAGRTAGGIALAQSSLGATLLTPKVQPVDTLGVARQFALHPSMTGLAGLFNAGKAAVRLNVGRWLCLDTQTVRQLGHGDLRPPQLFSHNDQQSIWQSSSPGVPRWAGVAISAIWRLTAA